MATWQKLTPVLVKITYWSKDSIITNKHHRYINSETYKVSECFKYKNGEFINLESLDNIGKYKNKTYFNVIKPIWSIDFISEISNNTLIEPYNPDAVENLLEMISDYDSCRIGNLIKDVENLFNYQSASEMGNESRKFIALFNEFSYYDSYAGDGDYRITYKKISNFEDILK